MVLLDNGRSELLADPEQREVLHCIRCGACLNVCPVFRKIGGHSYGTVYGGPIGSVLMPHLGGLNQYQHLSFASSLCGACTSACPAKIDLHHHLLQNRRNAVRSADRPAGERFAFKLWRWTMMGSQRFAFFGGAGRRLLRRAYALGLARTAARSTASLDQSPRGARTSRQIVSRALEGAAWSKLKTPVASGFSRASAARFAKPRRSTPRQLRGDPFSLRLQTRSSAFRRNARRISRNA